MLFDCDERGTGPSVGFNDDETFMRAVRSHSNLAEYTPLFLIALALSEIQGLEPTEMLIASALFVAGRLAHAYGFGIKGTGPGRVLGMFLTITALIVLSLNLLLAYIF